MKRRIKTKFNPGDKVYVLDNDGSITKGCISEIVVVFGFCNSIKKYYDVNLGYACISCVEKQLFNSIEEIKEKQQ